ncbi:MAG: hypothetical protein IPH57_13135 [Saprospiraceae bacterium]|nr:hypothetical protein [Saprospiraceae bacterium]
MEHINDDDSNHTPTRVSNSIFNSGNLLFTFHLTTTSVISKVKGISVFLTGIADPIALSKVVFYNHKKIICFDKTEQI